MDGALITVYGIGVAMVRVLTGWLQTGNNWYWLDPANDGVMSRGIVSVGSSRYYLSDSGAMVVGWAFDGTDWYYADGSGALASGWRLVNGVWYWLDVANDNRMATGFFVIGSNQYHFSSTGALSLGWFMSDGETGITLSLLMRRAL